MHDKSDVSSVNRTVSNAAIDDMYGAEVQPIFNQRCIACHSCLESPCQLNLQTYEGAQRGAIKGTLVYEGLRKVEAPLTRLFEDAHHVGEWRKKGFYDILGNSSQNSVLIESLKLSLEPRAVPLDEVKKNQFCSASVDDLKNAKNLVKENGDLISHKLAMPYGLPALGHAQIKTLREWVDAGAPGPRAAESIPEEMLEVKYAWERFLNHNDLKNKWVARYLYEHLFLANFYTNKHKPHFLKLVRSTTACGDGPHVIGTRRPNEDPKVARWYYCFVNSRGVAVDKTNIPYEMSLAKLAWLKKNFIDIDWQPEQTMSFSSDIASNPFKAFKAIPVSARYKFLLEDSHYQISTFIKGPVCNGTNAVNSIQEQFYTFFVNPESDLMVNSPEYAQQVVDQLALPGKWGSQVDILKALPEYRQLIDDRNGYRTARSVQLLKMRPNGLTLNDIWDGYGENDNAVLTIIRHNDNARVVKGAFGDLSRTAFVLDYSLLERMVYNLVVNFDVYGNVGHQFLTRVYMDLIRMEAENNFLDFLPQVDRLALKKKWYQGFLTGQKLSFFEEKQFTAVPAGITYAKGGNSQLEFVRKILFERLNEKVRGPVDPVNWKYLSSVKSQNPELNQLARVTSERGLYPRYFPEVSFLVVKENNIPKRGYTVIRNRQLKNVSWIMYEDKRLAPEEDVLMIGRGYHSSYPNQFLMVEANALPKMMNDLLSIKDQAGYEAFFKSYGVSRMDPWIWPLYDFIIQDFKMVDPVQAGYIDLSRYRL